MLLELNLKNFILIDDVKLKFKEGLNILTGETGAGKSILLEGLRIALGKRTSKDYLRNPEEKAVFELIFTTKDDLFAITREIYPSGKAISRLNGDITNVSEIEEKVARYLDIYGQRDHFLLLEPKYQMDLIDQFASKELESIFSELSSVKREGDELFQKLNALDAFSESDYEEALRIFDELHKLKLDPEKDATVEERFESLNHQKEIMEALEEASSSLEASLDGLYEASRAIDKMDRYFSLPKISERIQSELIELKDIQNEIKEESYSFDLDASEIEALEARFSALFEVQKKYQRSLEELKAYEEEKELEIKRYESRVSEREETRERIDVLLKKQAELTEKLRIKRKEAFQVLEEKLQTILSEVELKDVALDLRFDSLEAGKFYEKGSDRFEILASMNKNHLVPLKDSLSGGEMSRFILALKEIFSELEETETMIFDEIDTGISGVTAFQVGKLIQKLSTGKQIIAITHLPQLASFSDTHYIIEKIDHETSVRELDEQSAIDRLATMMTGSSTETSREGAKELIERAKKERK
ncbi:DNA repair protein RecN [Guggenheimella bovis]